jgi:hypothetical protein
MPTYKLIANPYGGNPRSVMRTDDDGQVWGIPFDPANTDYVAYLKWLEEGNVVEPADDA